MGEAEDELARLRAENARLRAMINRLERAGGNEPTPLAADTQIIRASEGEETLAPIKTARSPERPKKLRKKSKRKQKKEEEKESFLRGCLSVLLVVGGMTAVYLGLLVLSVVLSNGLQTFNFWSLLFGGLILSLVIGIVVTFIIGQIQEQQDRRQAAFLKKHRARLRRRITRKLRAAITQKLDTG